MTPNEHVELAAFLSSHGELLVREHRPAPAKQLNRYWTASRARWDRWMFQLKRFGPGESSAAKHMARRWPQHRAVIQQILVSEVPARVFGAVVAACDRHCGSQEGEPVVRSVLISHQEARRRALEWLLHSRGVPPDDAVALNRLRHQAERWTDLLVGYLAQRHLVAEFAAVPERARQFAEDFHDRPAWQPGQAAWKLLLASLRSRFRWPQPTGPATDELDADVATAIVDCFPQEFIEACGVGGSLWLHRINRVAEETHGMFEQLCQMEFRVR